MYSLGSWTVDLVRFIELVWFSMVFNAKEGVGELSVSISWTLPFCRKFQFNLETGVNEIYLEEEISSLIYHKATRRLLA